MPGLAIQTSAGFRFPVWVNISTIVAVIFIIYCALVLVELFLNAGVHLDLVTNGLSFIPLFFALACLLRAHRAAAFAINSDTELLQVLLRVQLAASAVVYQVPIRASR